MGVVRRWRLTLAGILVITWLLALGALVASDGFHFFTLPQVVRVVAVAPLALFGFLMVFFGPLVWIGCCIGVARGRGFIRVARGLGIFLVALVYSLVSMSAPIIVILGLLLLTCGAISSIWLAAVGLAVTLVGVALIALRLKLEAAPA
jgi:hypothetical protein